MEMYEYQKEALKTAQYPNMGNFNWGYPMLGLCGEVGEISEKLKKCVRDGKELNLEDITKELGDVLWYIAVLAHELGISLEDVAVTNVMKLRDRKTRGVIGGSGDNR